MDEVVKEFLVESHEALDRMDRDLVALEKDPHGKEILGSIFRAIHTVKRTSGFLGFGKLEAVAHVGENLLSKLRDGAITINPELTSALLATVDAVRYMLGQIELSGEPGSRDFTDLISLLSRLNDGPHEPPASTAAPVTLPETDVAVTSPPCPAAEVSTPANGMTPPARPTPPLPAAEAALRIKDSLTLAIISALIVTSGGDRFAIPRVSVLELLRLDSESPDRRVEFIDEAPVYRLRGQLLPLAYLNKALGLDPTAGLASAAINIVVLHADGHPFGLVVDEINDTEEIAVKPLGKQLKGVGSFAGATIMGDGRVALILDVLGLAQRAGVVAEIRDRSLLTKDERAVKAGKSFQTLILFAAGQGSRMAIPLSMVARLEEFPRSAVEHSGAQEVVRYGGQIMPLIRVSDHVPAVTPASTLGDPMQVVVYSENNRSVGLVVGEINDIVEEVITVKRHSRDKGIFGSVVIQDKVTDLLDVPAVIRAADPHFFPSATA